MKYSAPLDGIRAIAILSVLVFHVFPESLKGGFTGVDVFFVLSGFLITSIILQDLQNGTFSLVEFYKRRIQRLMPNAVLTVLAVLLLSGLILMPSSLQQVGRHSIWTLLNASNFFIWLHLGGYWGDSATSSPLLHTWSLAVEEQFYMLFPASLLFLVRLQRRYVTRWLVVATVLSLGLCIYATPRHAAVAFYMLPTRVWELLMGAALASYRMSHRGEKDESKLSSPLIKEWSGWLGLALVLAGFIFIDDTGAFPGVIALLPTVGTLLLLISVERETRVSKFLGLGIMAWIGRISYSLYLWHWPLITLGKILANRVGFSPIPGAVCGAVAGIILAWAAYKFVEQPLRGRGPGRALRLATIAAGFGSAIIASSWLGRETKLDTTRYFDPPEFHGVLYSVGKPDPERGQAIRYQDVRFPKLDGKNIQAWRSGGIIHAFSGGLPQVVVLGSSHALMYSMLIDSICKKAGVSVAFLGMDGVPVFFNSKVDPTLLTPREAVEFDEARRRWLRMWRPQVVFVIDRWDLRVTNSRNFDEDLRSFLREVSPLTKEVFFVAQIPVADTGGDSVNIRELMSWRMKQGDAVPRVFPDLNEQKRKQATGTAMAAMAEFPNLRVLRPDLAFYLEDHSIRWASRRTAYYTDDNHLSDAGAEIVRGIFEKAIAEQTTAILQHSLK